MNGIDDDVFKITEFIRGTVASANAKGVVVGLSGGVDSALVAALCVKALGKNSVTGVLMPTDFTPTKDTEDAKEFADQLGIVAPTVYVGPLIHRFDSSLMINADRDKVPRGNIIARIRMTILYYYANRHNLLVAGTGDKSEDLLGFFTKHGDGGVDFLPIAHLYKTEVRLMARYLGVPEEIAFKPSSPQLWPGHQAVHELPADYPALDPALKMLFDEHKTVKQVHAKTGVAESILMECLKRYEESKHKRSYPANLGGFR